ncbi:MAG: CoA-binding protein [Gemmatimonadaceae bacterium]
MTTSYVQPTDDELRAILTSARTIAMVGASSKRERPSFGVMKILMGAGFRVIPVTPKETSILGQKAYPSLAEIPEKVDIVDVFRRAEETPAIADEAARIGAKVLWLQLGIASEEAASRAQAAGLTLVMDTCIGQTTHRLDIKVAPEGPAA